MSIRSLNDLKKQEEEEGKRNEYFAGGLDNRGGGSGLAVVGPPNNSNNNRNNILDNIVQRAMNDAGSGEGGNAETTVRITLYSNGFQIDDGPFRDIQAPENRDFLNRLGRGEIPRELLQNNAAAAGGIDVHLTDKRSEEYKAPPPPAYVAFSGPATTLGSTSNTNAHSFSSSQITTAHPNTNTENPTTTIQVKTIGGKKLRIKICSKASVTELAAAIARESGESHDQFILSAGFPPKDITDPNQSIESAGLNGASITQKKA